MGKADLHSEKKRYTFPKREKLCSKKHIEELYKKGSSNFLYPFRIVYLSSQDSMETYPQVLISVPKRIFKKAVDRNRLKRQIREIYRLHKLEIFEGMSPEQIPDFLSIVYLGKEKLPYDTMKRKLITLLLRFRNT